MKTNRTSKLKKHSSRKIPFLMFHVDAEAKRLESKGHDIIYLAIGRSEENTPLEIIEEIQRSLNNPQKAQEVSPYGISPLRHKIAEYYKNEYKANVNSEDIYINHGTSNIYLGLFSLLFDPGDHILLPRPYYPLYVYSCKFSKLNPVFYDIDQDTFEINFKGIVSQINKFKPKMIVINSPGNPLGNLITETSLMQFINLSNSENIYLWSDETYGNVDFCGNFVSLTSLSYNPDLSIITSGFSKGFQMYTRRLGYCIIGEKIAEYLRPFLEHTVLTVDPCVQYGAIVAMDKSNNPVKLAKLYKERCEYFYRKFEQLKEFLTPRPEGGFNISIKCSTLLHKKSTLALALDILQKTGVAVTPGEDFGSGNTIRITLTSPRFKEGADRLHDYIVGLM